MTLPSLTFEQRASIATAEHLTSCFARLGMMRRAEIQDVIDIVEFYRPCTPTPLEAQAFKHLLGMLLALRDDDGD